MTDKEKELNEEQLKKAAGGHGSTGERKELSDAELGEASGAGGDLSKGPADGEESEEEN